MPQLSEEEVLDLIKFIPDRQFTQPPSRYTEATLIRALEEKGIGRPSTYAPTISTISAHNYVVRDGRYLKPTAMGDAVNELLKEHFPDIVDLKFTNHMESELDEVESGKVDWKSVFRKKCWKLPRISKGSRLRFRMNSAMNTAMFAADRW